MAKVKDVKQLAELNDSATYLLLISPEKIPHLAVICHGKYFSLTHKKVVMNEPFEPYFRYLKKSGRKMLFIELNLDLIDFEAYFSRYTRAGLEADTCLVPIKESVLPFSKAQFVFELIPDLYNADKIKNAFHLNLAADLTDLGDFNLSIYPKEAIFSYIESLNQKYAKRQ